MKNITIIYICCFVFVTCDLFSFDFKLNNRFGVGFYPVEYKEKYEVVINDDNMYFTDMKYNDLGIFKATIGEDLYINDFKLYFTNFIYADKREVFFSPTIMEFYTGINYKINDKINLNIEHLCIHSFRDFTKNTPNKYGGYNFLIELRYGY